MRHFETKKQAVKFRDEQRKTFSNHMLHVWKKGKGQPNRTAKPFMVGTELDWLNWGN